MATRHDAVPMNSCQVQVGMQSAWRERERREAACRAGDGDSRGPTLHYQESAAWRGHWRNSRVTAC